MSASRRSIERAVVYIGQLFAVVSLGSVCVWLFLMLAGISLPLPGIVVTFVIAVGYFATSDSRRPPAPPPPPSRPRRQITWEDTQRAATLYRAGLITKEQFEATLAAVVPPTQPTPNETPRHGWR